MSDFLTIDDFDLDGKTVLLRADLNVPMKGGVVTDATRLERLRPTFQALLEKNAKIVVLSHLGRPDGQRNEAYSLRPVAAKLGEVLGRKVAFAADCIGPVAQDAVQALVPGAILVLENTRFYPGEEKNDPALAQEMAKLGDVFVNDAFSAAHRAHASTAGLAAFLPAAAGKLMEEELTALSRALEHPKRPLLALVGGSKISTKLDLLQNLIAKVDVLVLGGGMANTFLAARGTTVGASLYEADMLETARTIDAQATAKGCEILLPVDVVVAAELKVDAAISIVPAEKVGAEQKIFDLGPASVAAIGERLKAAKTVIWNGPLGVFEVPPFDRGTAAVAQLVAQRTQSGALLSVAGGGDTVAALAQAEALDKLSYVSTAGGAFLEWLEGKDLPGVAALRK